MSKRTTFIHAADLHLGAPFRGLRGLSEKWADRLLLAIPESYDHLIEAALKHKVDFVIMAGDIFDSSRPSYADFFHFFKGLKRLDEAGIAVYLCSGNHDPYTTWKQDLFALPPNTHLFPADKPGFVVFEKEGSPLVLLGGRGYYTHAWPADEDIAGGISRAAAEKATGVQAPFGVGVVHTGLDIDCTKAPTDPKKLLHSGMDYWALGHIHLKQVYSEENPQLVFSGCIQGRDIKETGERGIFKVVLEEGATNKVEFIPTASVVWQRLCIDIGDCANLVEVNEKIMRELFHENSKSHCEEMCVRVTLVGKTELHRALGNPGVLRDIRKSINDAYPVFFCDALIDRTEAAVDKEALKKEGLFPAVFMQVSSSFKDDRDEQVAYLQEEFLDYGMQLPKTCEKHIDELAEEAENLVLDLLSGSS